MNHTQLWKDNGVLEEDERIGEDLLSPTTHTSDTKKTGSNKNPRSRTKNGGSGSWLLRQSIGKGPSLGEKIGESVERAAYKAVAGAGKLDFPTSLQSSWFFTVFCSVMSALARALSGLHGLNVLKNADVS